MKKVSLFVILVAITLLSACSNSPRLTDDQQEVWDLIEARIDEGYETWDELVDWAVDEGILWGPRIEGQRPEDAVVEQIREYGLVGNYVNSTPGFGAEELGNGEEIILYVNFEDLSHNEEVANLETLDTNSVEVINDWLEDGGMDHLEETFSEVIILDVDIEGEDLEIHDELDLEFETWLVATNGFVSFENSRIVIGRVWKIAEPSAEEVQEIIIEKIDSMDRNTHIESFGRKVSPSLSQLGEWLDIKVDLLELASIDNISALRSNTEGQSLPGNADVDESNFNYWEFTYEVNDSGSMELNFTLIYDIEVEEPVSTEFKNALSKGREYLKSMNFSFTSLSSQLDYEGFSSEAIVWAMDQIDADTDWYEQAVGKAESYLNSMSFSPASLIDQLMYEGFTQSQAEHAVRIVFE